MTSVLYSAVWLSLLASGQNAQPAASAPAIVVTIDGERITAPLVKIDQGKLLLATDPPRALPLDELERVELAVAKPLELTWIGQDGRDLVQVGGMAGGNGIQDMHLRLSGLPPDRKITQIIALCRFPGKLSTWRLDTTRSPHWKIAVERADRSSTAELFLEPAAGDAFDQPFELTLTYDDQSTAKLSVKATTHTQNQLQVLAAPTTTEAAVAADAGPLVAVVHCEGRDQLRGQVLALGEQVLTLKTAWQAELQIPLLQTLGMQFGAAPTAEARQLFAAQLARPGNQDNLMVIGRDGKIATISGSMQGLSDGKVKFAFDGEARSIDASRVAGLILAVHPPVRSSVSPIAVVRLAANEQISGEWTGVSEKEIELRTTWGQRVAIPRGSVQEIRFRNGRLVYLSDLEPVSVEETPYFGRRMPYRRDVNLLGGALRLKGKDYSKGLAVHSRSVLTYALDGQFEAFKAIVGFDEASQGKGAVACRVLLDGKEAFSRPTLRGADDPASIEIPVLGAKQLTLEVDFGEREDIGDRVIWADARLWRQTSKSAAGKD